MKLRRDPADAGRLHVYLADGSFLCVAENPGYTGAKQATIAANMTADYQKQRSAARKRARDLKRRKDPGGAADRTLARAKTQAERVIALPRKGQDHQTPALTQAGLAAQAADKADKAAGSAGPGDDLVERLGAASELFLKEKGWA